MQPGYSLPPHLPASYTDPARPWATALFLGYALALAFLPGVLSYLLLAGIPSAWPWTVLPVALLSTIAGFGFYVIGTTAHEGFHFNLGRSKWTSAVLGTWVSAAIIGFFGVGFYLVHSQHHRYTNQEQDPDYQLFSRFRRTWHRLLVLRMVNNRTYVKIVAALLSRSQLPDGVRTVFSLDELKMLARINVVAQLFWISCYIAMLIINPLLALCCVLLPHLATAVVSATIVFVQHADTGHALSDNARTHSSPLVTLLMGGTNYHLEHHLYPRVPCWRLAGLHRWLCKSAWAQQNPLMVEKKFWRGFLLCRERFPYGRRVQQAQMHVTDVNAMVDG